MSVYLKVKLKTLAEEARIIKREENKRKVPARSRPLVFRDKPPAEHAVLAKHPRMEHAAARAKRRGRDWYPKSAAELQGLHLHRIQVVRKEARLTQIAYGFIRGRSFDQVDSGRDLRKDDWDRIGGMVKKYGKATDAGVAVASWAGVKLV